MKHLSNNPVSFQCISKYRNVLMGLAILCIILFHFTEDCVTHGYNVFPIVKYYYAGVGSSGVDVFLFLSGLGLYYSFKKNPNLKAFYSKRFIRLLIPYFIVAAPMLFLWDVIFSKGSLSLFAKDLFFVTFFTDGALWFWYILMALVCYLIFPLFFDYIDGPDSKSRMLFTFIVITVLALLLRTCNYDFYMRTNIATARFPAFFLGCFVGKAAYEKAMITYKDMLLILLAILLLPLKISSVTPLSRYILGAFAIAVFILFAIGMEILDRHNVKWNGLRKIIEWFGNYSLELYLTHVALRHFMLYALDLPTYRIRYECLLIVPIDPAFCSGKKINKSCS